MAVPVIESITNSSSTGTSMVVDMPASPTVGNLLVMIFGYFTTFSAGGLTAWTQQQYRSSASNYGAAIYTRVVDGTESATYTATGFVSTETRNCSVLEVSGHDGVDASALGFSTSSSSSWTSPSVTTTVADDLVIREAFTGQTSKTGSFAWAGTETVVTEFYSAAQSSGGFWGRLQLVTFPAPSAAAQGTVTITPPAANEWCAATIAIKASVLATVTADDTMTFTDTATVAAGLPAQDAFAFTDTAKVIVKATDTVGFTDTAFASSIVVASDTFSFADTATAGPAMFATIPAADTFSFTDTAHITATVHADDTITFTDAAQVAGIPPPDGRLYPVAFEDRFLPVDVEDRFIQVLAEDRTLRVDYEDRYETVPVPVEDNSV